MIDVSPRRCLRRNFTSGYVGASCQGWGHPRDQPLVGRRYCSGVVERPWAGKPFDQPARGGYSAVCQRIEVLQHGTRGGEPWRAACGSPRAAPPCFTIRKLHGFHNTYTPTTQLLGGGSPTGSGVWAPAPPSPSAAAQLAGFVASPRGPWCSPGGTHPARTLPGGRNVGGRPGWCARSRQRRWRRWRRTRRTTPPLAPAHT